MLVKVLFLFPIILLTDAAQQPENSTIHQRNIHFLKFDEGTNHTYCEVFPFISVMEGDEIVLPQDTQWCTYPNNENERVTKTTNESIIVTATTAVGGVWTCSYQNVFCSFVLSVHASHRTFENTKQHNMLADTESAKDAAELPESSTEARRTMMFHLRTYGTNSTCVGFPYAIVQQEGGHIVFPKETEWCMYQHDGITTNMSITVTVLSTRPGHSGIWFCYFKKTTCHFYMHIFPHRTVKETTTTRIPKKIKLIIERGQDASESWIYIGVAAVVLVILVCAGYCFYRVRSRNQMRTANHDAADGHPDESRGHRRRPPCELPILYPSSVSSSGAPYYLKSQPSSLPPPLRILSLDPKPLHH